MLGHASSECSPGDFPLAGRGADSCNEWTLTPSLIFGQISLFGLFAFPVLGAGNSGYQTAWHCGETLALAPNSYPARASSLKNWVYQGIWRGNCEELQFVLTTHCAIFSLSVPGSATPSTLQASRATIARRGAAMACGVPVCQ